MSKQYKLETRGGVNRRKSFIWWYDEKKGILNIQNEEGLFHKFDIDEILQILDTVKSEFGENYFPLANNVEKLGNGSEVRGLGTIILEQSPKDLFHAQGASYFGPVFEHVGFFAWNGKSRGIHWRLINRETTNEAIIQAIQTNDLRDTVIFNKTQNNDLTPIFALTISNSYK